MFHDLEHHRQHRYGNDAERDQREVVFDDGHVAEDVARPHADCHPADTARDVVEKERAGLHFRCARDERKKRADDGHEARENHGLSAVQLEEFMGPFDVVGVDEPVRKCRPIAETEQPRPDAPADGIVDPVAENRRADQQDVAQPGVEHSRRAESAHCEQQRIARQKRRDHEARFRKDDDEQDSVDPRPVLLDELEQMFVEMKDKIDELRHAGGLFTGGRHDVADDEQLLSWAHEPELAAGDLLDGRGVFAQAARVFAE